MDPLPPDDFDPYVDPRVAMTSNRELITLGAVVLGIFINIGTLAWYGGKIDQRVSNVEGEVTELKAKASKDATQDVQIAVIGVQLAAISAGVGEIKTKLEQRK